MSIAVTALLTSVQRHFPEIPQATFLDLLNEVDGVIQNRVKLFPQSSQDVPIVSGVQAYSIPGAINRAWDVGYYPSSGSYQKLEPTTVDFLDYQFSGWRTPSNTGVPTLWYEDGGSLGLYPVPNISSGALTPNWTITGLSDATPIAVTTSANHDLSTGRSVTIAGALGNTVANGTWLITVTSPTSFTLDNSVGNGAYTSGATITVADYPLVRIATLMYGSGLTIGSSLPAQVKTPDAWVYGILRRYALIRHREQVPLFAPFEKDAMEVLGRSMMGRNIRRKARVSVRVPQPRIL